MDWFDSMIKSTPAWSKHRDRLRALELNGETLLNLTLEELKGEGFPFGPCKQIMDRIGKINSNVGGQNVRHDSESQSSQGAALYHSFFHLSEEKKETYNAETRIDIDTAPLPDEMHQSSLGEISDYDPSLFYVELKYCISTCTYRHRVRKIEGIKNDFSFRAEPFSDNFTSSPAESTESFFDDCPWEIEDHNPMESINAHILQYALEKNPRSVDHLKILALCAKWTLMCLPRLSPGNFQNKLTPEMKQQRCIVFQETMRRPSYGGVIESQWISDCKKNSTVCGNKEGVWIFKSSMHQIIVFGEGKECYPQNCKGMGLTQRDFDNYLLWRANEYVEIQYKYYWHSEPVTYKIIWSRNYDGAGMLDCLDNLSKYYPEAVHKLGHVSFIRTIENGSEEMTSPCAEDAVDIHQVEDFIAYNRMTMISVCHMMVHNGSVWLRSDNSPYILRTWLNLDATQEFEFTTKFKAGGKRTKLPFRDPCHNKASSIELPKIWYELQKLLKASTDKIILVSVVSRQQGVKQSGTNAGMEHIIPGADVRITTTKDHNYDSRKRVREDTPKIEGEKRHKQSGCVETVRAIRVTEENVQRVREMVTDLKRKAEDKNSRVVRCKIELCSTEEYDAFVEEDEKPLNLNEDGHNTYIRVYGEEYYRSMSLPTDKITMDTLKSRV
ncbi:hypothetical protein PROFUN_16050, partial [Planoprotostelium fungivorum]